MRFLGEHRTPAVTAFARAVQEAGDSTALLAVAGLVVLGAVAARRAWGVAAAAVLALVAATLAARFLKGVVQRPRPGADLALLPLDGWAMPSTHAARTAAITAAVLVAATWTASAARHRGRVVTVLVAANVLVGVLMVYLGAHWPSDVLAGWCVGAFWAGLCWYAALLLQRKGQVETEAPPTPPKEAASRVPGS